MSVTVQVLLALVLFLLVIECHLIFVSALKKGRAMQAFMALVMMSIVILVSTVLALGMFA